MSNVDKICDALGLDASQVPADKAELVNGLSDEEVNKLIELGGKIAHSDDEFGPFPV